MTTARTSALAVYRNLLRAINKNITPVSQNKLWAECAREYFKSFRSTEYADPIDQQKALQQAIDYTDLINGIREHKELLLSYNVGIPIEEREKNMNARAAQLVGLAMPPPRILE